MRMKGQITGFKLSYSVDEAAFLTNSCRDKIYGAIKNGLLKAKQDGRRTIILHDDLDAYEKALPELDLTDKRRHPPSRKRRASMVMATKRDPEIAGEAQ